MLGVIPSFRRAARLCGSSPYAECAIILPVTSASLVQSDLAQTQPAAWRAGYNDVTLLGIAC